MVGFGSALRLSRRNGWERAYLDYESLKLLLAQIEAVYEEPRYAASSGATARSADAAFVQYCNNHQLSQYSFVGPSLTPASSEPIDNDNGSVGGDFRDELFLLSDSDEAFASSSSSSSSSSVICSADDYEEDVEQGEAPCSSLAKASAYSQKPASFPPRVEWRPPKSRNSDRDDKKNRCCLHFCRRGSYHGPFWRKQQPRRHQHCVMDDDFVTRHWQQHEQDMYRINFASSEDSLDHRHVSSGPLWHLPTMRSSHRQRTGEAFWDDKPRGGERPGTGTTLASKESESFFFDRHFLYTSPSPAEEVDGEQVRSPQGKIYSEGTATTVDQYGTLEPTGAWNGDENCGVGDAGDAISEVYHSGGHQMPHQGLEREALLNDTGGDGGVGRFSGFGIISPPQQHQQRQQEQLHDGDEETRWQQRKRLENTFPRRTPRRANGDSDGGGGGEERFTSFRPLRRREVGVTAAGICDCVCCGRGRARNKDKACNCRQRRLSRYLRRFHRRIIYRCFLWRRKECRYPSSPLRHLRIAHEKARAITERFLGLLRAECEKVQLFAHAKMGELADTLGSIRFADERVAAGCAVLAGAESFSSSSPSFSFGGVNDMMSDQGMHPSASSSSDEGDAFPPPFSSSRARREQRHGFDDVERTRNATVTRTPRRKGKLRRGTSGRSRALKYECQDVRQQSRGRSQGKQPRRRKRKRTSRTSIFQRSEQVVGEDSILLSAVDEVDAYLMVAVELLHLIRFVCVNALAARKIIRKHDRLLSNRMLGGYYHYKRRKRRQALAARTQSEQRKRIRGSVNNRRKRGRAPRGGMTLQKVANAESWVNHGGNVNGGLGGYGCSDRNGGWFWQHTDRLQGSCDAQLQNLANCQAVKSISSSLESILTEYEVTQNRAFAFSQFPTSEATPQHKVRQDAEQTPSATLSPHSPPRSHAGYLLFSTGACFPVLRSGRCSSGIQGVTGGPVDSDEGSNGTGESFNSEDGRGESDGTPSTASTISLARLRYAVISIEQFRRAAVCRRSIDAFRSNLSRHAMSYIGTNIVGQGLAGSSREALGFLRSYDADSAVHLNASSIHRALVLGGNEVLFSGTDNNRSWRDSEVNIYCDDKPSKYSVWTDICCCYLTKGALHKDSSRESFALVTGVDPVTLFLNTSSVFLYRVNYYAMSPLAHACVLMMGSHPSFSAPLIGASSFGAMLSACLQTYWSVVGNWNGERMFSQFRPAFVVSSLCAIAGNILLAVASINSCLPLALCSRVLIGFGSSDVLSRRLVSCCVLRGKIVEESAKIVSSRAVALFVGTMIASLVSVATRPKNRYVLVSGVAATATDVLSSEHSSSSGGPRLISNSICLLCFIMSLLWWVHLLGLLVAFDEPVPIRPFVRGPLWGAAVREEREEGGTEEFDSDTSFCYSVKATGSHSIENNSSADAAATAAAANDVDDADCAVASDAAHRKSSNLSRGGASNLRATYGSSSYPSQCAIFRNVFGTHNVEAPSPSATTSAKKARRRRYQFWCRSRLVMNFYRIRALLCTNMALPVASVVMSYSDVTIEVIFSSCAIITHTYFEWNYAVAATLLAILGSTILPITFMLSRVLEFLDERVIMKKSLRIMGLSMVVLLNFQALFNSVFHVLTDFSKKAADHHFSTHHPPSYDSSAFFACGQFQYLVGTITVFTSTVFLRGASLSLMSRVAQTKLNYTVVNCGLLATLIAALSRLVADVVIAVVVAFSELGNRTDIINSLFVPMIGFCCAACYIVKRHYFFLI